MFSVRVKASRLIELINAKRKRIAEGSIESFGGPSYKDEPGNIAYVKQKNKNEAEAKVAKNKAKHKPKEDKVKGKK
jgi:hypothetical protein